MRTVNLAKAKDELSRHVEYARRGGRVRILVRGKPAADLVPVESASSDEDVDGEMAQLERDGVVRRGIAGKWPEELDRPGPALRRGVSAADVLVRERSSGR